MEIHPPHGAIASLKDLLVHLFTITLGILIALSFEGAREWHRERTLVREARESLAQEMRENKRSLDNMFAQLPKYQKEQEELLGALRDVLAHKSLAGRHLTLEYSIASLETTAWRTAQGTGALARMDYAEARKYSEVYGLQEEYNQRQHQSLDRMLPVLQTLKHEDPEKLSREETLHTKQAVIGTLAELAMETDFAKRLSEMYGEALQQEARR